MRKLTSISLRSWSATSSSSSTLWQNKRKRKLQPSKCFLKSSKSTTSKDLSCTLRCLSLSLFFPGVEDCLRPSQRLSGKSLLRRKVSRRERERVCCMTQLWRLRLLDGVKNPRKTFWSFPLWRRNKLVEILSRTQRQRRSLELQKTSLNNQRTEPGHDYLNVKNVKDHPNHWVISSWDFYRASEECCRLCRIYRWYHLRTYCVKDTLSSFFAMCWHNTLVLLKTWIAKIYRL